MDMQRKRQLTENYKNRKPEMGVLSFYCKETGDTFLYASKDIPAYRNGTLFKMACNGHPSKLMQSLWNTYGEDSYEISVLELLKYDNPNDDHEQELEDMLLKYLELNRNAGRIWK